MAARISLCLIARDEEGMVPGCLDSVRGAVDEIIVVDTGSTDRTAAIARAAGARVLEQRWNDDFSAPRNLALDHARGDWVLQLDADERLAPGGAIKVRDAVATTGADALFVRLHDADRSSAGPEEVVSGAARRGDPTSLMRLFRRLPGLRYRGPIHETLGESLAAHRARFALADVDVVHMGGAPDLRAARAKQARNVSILRRCCQEDPQDVTWPGYLAMELYSAGFPEDAKTVAERGWSALDGQPRTRSLKRLAVARATIALNEGAPSRALETIAELEHRERHLGPDALMLRGLAQLQLAMDARDDDRRGHAEAASETFRAALRRDGEPEQLIPGSGSWASSCHLGTARLAAGDFPGALAALRAAQRRDCHDPAVSLGIAECQLEMGDVARAAEQLMRGLLDDRPDGWVLAARAAHRLGSPSDARMLLTEAHRRLSAGFRCALRRETAQELADALAADQR